jgi:hypothetical protein
VIAFDSKAVPIERERERERRTMSYAVGQREAVPYGMQTRITIVIFDTQGDQRCTLDEDALVSFGNGSIRIKSR